MIFVFVFYIFFVSVFVIVFAFIFAGRMDRRPIITCSASGRRSCAFASLAPFSRWPQINLISCPMLLFLSLIFFYLVFVLSLPHSHHFHAGRRLIFSTAHIFVFVIDFVLYLFYLVFVIDFASLFRADRRIIFKSDHASKAGLKRQSRSLEYSPRKNFIISFSRDNLWMVKKESIFK